MNKIIEAWIDFTSPFSYLGVRNLEKALKLTNREDLIISYRTFQIDPEFNNLQNQDVKDFNKFLIQQKDLLDYPQVKNLIQQTGILFDFKKIIPVNTLNAHCLIHLEQRLNKTQSSEIVGILFHAFWSSGIDISDIEILKQIANSAGVDEQLVIEATNDKQILNEILKDEHEATDYGVSAVPHFRFPNGDQLQGLITIEQALELIKKNI